LRQREYGGRGLPIWLEMARSDWSASDLIEDGRSGGQCAGGGWWKRRCHWCCCGLEAHVRADESQENRVW
jgi:hypothetical protein